MRSLERFASVGPLWKGVEQRPKLNVPEADTGEPGIQDGQAHAASRLRTAKSGKPAPDKLSEDPEGMPKGHTLNATWGVVVPV